MHEDGEIFTMFRLEAVARTSDSGVLEMFVRVVREGEHADMVKWQCAGEGPVQVGCWVKRGEGEVVGHRLKDVL